MVYRRKKSKKSQAHVQWVVAEPRAQSSGKKSKTLQYAAWPQLFCQHTACVNSYSGSSPAFSGSGVTGLDGGCCCEHDANCASGACDSGSWTCAAGGSDSSAAQSCDEVCDRLGRPCVEGALQGLAGKSDAEMLALTT